MRKEMETPQKAAAWVGTCPVFLQVSTASHPTRKRKDVSRKGSNEELGNKEDELTFHLN